MGRQKKKPAPSAAEQAREPSSRPRLWMLAKMALLVVVTIVVYWPAMSGTFILDDPRLIAQNDLVKDQNGLYQIWFTTHAIDYWPVTNTIFWVEYRIFGENPIGYHVVNLALHLLNCLLIWLVLSELAVPGAYFAAVLFAIHPVNVESVAWISQLKNVLSMFFFLLSIHWYLKAQPGASDSPMLAQRHASPNSWQQPSRWLGLSLFAFTLAMLSKGSVAMLPLVLLLIAYWRNGRVSRSDLLRTSPFFAIALVLTCVNIWFQTHGLDNVIREATPLQRLLGAAAAVWFYLSKALWPTNLLFVYPQWNIVASNILWWLPLLAAILLTAALFWQRRRAWCWPLLIAWIYYCVALAPALGFVDVGYMKFTLVSDHYQYIALIGIVAVIAAGWSVYTTRHTAMIRSLAKGLAIALIGLMTVLARRQSCLYASPIVLYQLSLDQNPNSWILQNNLAAELNRVGRWADGLPHTQASLRLNPINPLAHFNLGDELVKLNRPLEAIPNYRAALREQPDYVNAQMNLGVALFYTGQLDAALPELQKALPFKPESFELHNDLATVLLQKGSTAEAVKYFERALQLQPDSAEVAGNLAEAYARLNRFGNALSSAKEALRLAQSQGKSDLAAAIQQWLADFNSKHPDSGTQGLPPTTEK